MLALVLLVLAVDGTMHGLEQGDPVHSAEEPVELVVGGTMHGLEQGDPVHSAEEPVELVVGGTMHGLEQGDGILMTGGGGRIGTPGPTDEGSCACDIDIAGGGAYVELLKQGDEYQSMNQEQRDAYVAMAIDFITPKNAYECARNALLVESAEIALQMGSANDSLRAGELAAEYGAVMQKLEELGVGQQDETGADPSHYFEKYDQAVGRLGGPDGCGAAGARGEEASPDGMPGQG